MLCGRIEYDCRKKGKWPLLGVTDRPSLFPAAPDVSCDVCASEGRSRAAQRQRQEEATIYFEVEISHDSKTY